MKRFIFSSHYDLREPNIAAHLLKSISGMFGDQSEIPTPATGPILESMNMQRYTVERSETWFVVIYSPYTFEIARNGDNGIQGLEQMSSWLTFRLKDHVSLAT